MKKLSFSESQKVNENFLKVIWFWIAIFSSNWETVNIATILSRTGKFLAVKPVEKNENRKTASKVWFNYFFLKTWPLEDTKTPKEVKFLKKKLIKNWFNF